MRTSERGARVSALSRVLAAALAAASAFAILQFVLSMGRHEEAAGTGDPLGLFLLAIGAPLLLAASAFVAITGRSPRWMTKLEMAQDKKLVSDGDVAQSVERVRRMARLGALVSSGVLLSVLGFSFHLFSGETPWVGIGILSIAWAVIAVLLWRHFGKRLPGDRSRR